MSLSRVVVPLLIRERINKIINMKNKTLAIVAATPAKKPNPKKANTRAIIIKSIALRNIILIFYYANLRNIFHITKFYCKDFKDSVKT